MNHGVITPATIWRGLHDANILTIRLVASFLSDWYRAQHQDTDEAEMRNASKMRVIEFGQSKNREPGFDWMRYLYFNPKTMPAKNRQDKTFAYVGGDGLLHSVSLYKYNENADYFIELFQNEELPDDGVSKYDVVVNRDTRNAFFQNPCFDTQVMRYWQNLLQAVNFRHGRWVLYVHASIAEVDSMLQPAQYMDENEVRRVKVLDYIIAYLESRNVPFRLYIGGLGVFFYGFALDADLLVIAHNRFFRDEDAEGNSIYSIICDIKDPKQTALFEEMVGKLLGGGGRADTRGQPLTPFDVMADKLTRKLERVNPMMWEKIGTGITRNFARLFIEFRLCNIVLDETSRPLWQSIQERPDAADYVAVQPSAMPIQRTDKRLLDGGTADTMVETFPALTTVRVSTSDKIQPSLYLPCETYVPSVILMRHGTREDNRLDHADWPDKRFRPYDPPLNTKNGIALVFESVKELQLMCMVDRIVTSPFRRCIETAMVAAAVFEIRTVTIDNRLGERVAQLNRTQSPSDITYIEKSEAEAIAHRVVGTKNPVKIEWERDVNVVSRKDSDTLNRQMEAVKEYKEMSASTGLHVLIVTHGDVISHCLPRNLDDPTMIRYLVNEGGWVIMTAEETDGDAPQNSRNMMYNIDDLFPTAQDEIN